MEAPAENRRRIRLLQDRVFSLEEDLRELKNRLDDRGVADATR